MNILLTNDMTLIQILKQVAQRATIAHLRASKISKYLNSSEVSKQPRKTETPFSPLYITQFGYFLGGQGQVIILSVSNLAKIEIHQRHYKVPPYLQVKNDYNSNRENVETMIF